MIVNSARFVKRFFHEFAEPSVRVRQIKRGRDNAGFQAVSSNDEEILPPLKAVPLTVFVISKEPRLPEKRIRGRLAG
jgi:hypothetical protein